MQSQDQLIAIIELSKVGIFDWNIQNNTVNFSEQMKSDWEIDSGCTLEDTITRIDPRDRKKVGTLIENSVQNGQPYFCEYRLITPSGKKIWIEARGQVSYDPENQPFRFLGTSLNITSRKAVQVRLEAAVADADKANKAKSAFLANMSHEIRTPLTAILGFTNLIEKSQSSKDRSLFSSIVKRNGKILLQLINDILDLSKVEAGRIELEQINFKPKKLISEIIDIFSKTAKDKNIKILVSIDLETPELVKSDPVRIRQILLNLIGNAIKFTNEGFVKVMISPFLKNNTQSGLKFLVEDSGVGFSKHHSTIIFEPFTQADEGTTRKYGGSGLGLSLSKKLAQTLGGDVRVIKCKVNKGCTFEATVLTQKADIPKPIELNYKFNPIDKLKKLKILLAEDCEDNYLLVKEMLNISDLEVELDIVTNGLQAIEKALQENYDLVLMDMQMPMLDGYQATRKLRQQGYTKPIVAITANAMKEERIKTLEAGCNAHLSKPFNLDTLVEIIKTYSL